ncbi:hypothetical protein SSCG_00123 [Streptomyces clavuligerus]|nr:hypothetical protein SSCG_00123 [Streptomyces clavuligerus]
MDGPVGGISTPISLHGFPADAVAAASRTCSAHASVNRSNDRSASSLPFRRRPTASWNAGWAESTAFDERLGIPPRTGAPRPPGPQQRSGAEFDLTHAGPPPRRSAVASPSRS